MRLGVAGDCLFLEIFSVNVFLWIFFIQCFSLDFFLVHFLVKKTQKNLILFLVCLFLDIIFDSTSVPQGSGEALQCAAGALPEGSLLVLAQDGGYR